jgi:hypothetical protein
MNDSPLNAALRHFEATEANLKKIEKVLEEIRAAIPDGVASSKNRDYDDNCLPHPAQTCANRAKGQRGLNEKRSFDGVMSCRRRSRI